MIPSYAIIPTSNRPDVAMLAVEAASRQFDVVIVVDNGDNIPFPGPDDSRSVPAWHVLGVDRHGQPPNLAELWNRGLNLVGVDSLRSGPEYDVALINDDAIIPEGWLHAVSTEMRARGAAAGSSGSPTGVPVHYEQPGPVGLYARMQGFAFVLAGERGVRADPSLHWYFGDDDLDWQSRLLGGTVVIPGYPVQHLHPNGQMTPELHHRTSLDAQAFLDKWKMMPW